MRAEKLRNFAASMERILSEVALRFCLDHPYVSSTLIGISTTLPGGDKPEAAAEDNRQGASGPGRGYSGAGVQLCLAFGRPENQI